MTTSPTQGEHAQPEAIRLAEWLESAASNADMGRKPQTSDHRRRAAAELRRLHAQVAALTAAPQGGASPATDEELDLLLSAARSAGYHAGRADTMRASHGQAPAGAPGVTVAVGSQEFDLAETGARFTTADMATACGQAFREGQAAPTAQPAPAAKIPNAALADLHEGLAAKLHDGPARNLHLETAAALRASAAGNWIAADDVNRLVRELDVCLNGEAGAAAQASLCDVVAQVRHETAKRGQPLLAAPAAGPSDSEDSDADR